MFFGPGCTLNIDYFNDNTVFRISRGLYEVKLFLIKRILKPEPENPNISFIKFKKIY